ncbi:MAG TPA: hypothetical protein VGC97_04595, partial [Pyrinomonadaceae bacterium]
GAKRQRFCFLMRLCSSSGKLSFFYLRFALVISNRVTGQTANRVWLCTKINFLATNDTNGTNTLLNIIRAIRVIRG